MHSQMKDVTASPLHVLVTHALTSLSKKHQSSDQAEGLSSRGSKQQVVRASSLPLVWHTTSSHEEKWDQN
jgi:hypothetical protein